MKMHVSWIYVSMAVLCVGEYGVLPVVSLPMTAGVGGRTPDEGVAGRSGAGELVPKMGWAGGVTDYLRHAESLPHGLPEEGLLSSLVKRAPQFSPIGSLMVGMPGLTSMRPLPAIGSSIPALPSIAGSSMPGLPSMGSSVPSLPGLGSMPSLPGVGSMPNLPGVGSMGGMPGLSSLGGLL